MELLENLERAYFICRRTARHYAILCLVCFLFILSVIPGISDSSVFYLVLGLIAIASASQAITGSAGWKLSRQVRLEHYLVRFHEGRAARRRLFEPGSRFLRSSIIFAGETGTSVIRQIFKSRRPGTGRIFSRLSRRLLQTGLLEIAAFLAAVGLLVQMAATTDLLTQMPVYFAAGWSVFVIAILGLQVQGMRLLLELRGIFREVDEHATSFMTRLGVPHAERSSTRNYAHRPVYRTRPYRIRPIV